MTKTDALAQIQSAFPALTTEQALALAAIAEAWTRDAPRESDATRAAIAEGLAQAEAGTFASPNSVANLIAKRWA
jgi:predicted transcriptional regulator